MIMSALDQKIRNGFSDAAIRYDRLTGLHKEIGEKLVKKIKRDDPCLRMLDIGMGTGGFTDLLTIAFPDTVVVGIDFASGMIDRAQEKKGTFKIVQADASFLPFKEWAFDIITSNLAYQWVGNLSKAFELCHSKLNKNGRLYLTMFGHDTFDELFKALAKCTDKNGFKGHRLAGEDQITNALENSGFRNIARAKAIR